jgi:serine/threonine protein kinase
VTSSTGAPEWLGAYRLLEKLGQGGMAVVYRAERSGDAGFRKKVAIKRMLPQYRRDPSLLERFAAEARTNARLDHPNLVQVLDFGIEPEPFLVLEFVEGVTLGAIMQKLAERRERIDVAAACFIGAEVAAGLDHAHRKKGDDGTPLGIVHRDVSPQNVLVSNEGTVKVSDFGLVKAADNVLKTMSGVTIGKLSYMAPEQADGKDVDGRADVFSLGVTIWEMLTIRSLIPPDDPLIAAQLLRSGDFVAPSTINPDVPPDLDRIVMACLRIDPEARTPSAQQVSQELRELLHERAAGYGRQQLARMVQWLFPEKGWELPEPERPPAQPSPDERASIMPATPVAIAVARAQSDGPAAGTTGAHATVASATGPIDVLRTSVIPPPPAAPSRATASLPHLAIAAMVGAASVLLLAMIALGAIWMLRTEERADAARAAGDSTAVPPSIPLGASVRFESRVPGIRVFLGPRELGPTPQVLTPRDLTGEPLVALAAGYQPLVIRAERLVELSRAVGRVHEIDLEPTRRPDVMVYVRYDGQGTAHTPEGEDLGSVPGVIRVPTRRDRPTPTAITVFDELGQHSVTLSLMGCEADKVCVLYAGAAS